MKIRNGRSPQHPAQEQRNAKSKQVFRAYRSIHLDHRIAHIPMAQRAAARAAHHIRDLARRARHHKRCSSVEPPHVMIGTEWPNYRAAQIHLTWNWKDGWQRGVLSHEMGHHVHRRDNEFCHPYVRTLWRAWALESRAVLRSNCSYAHYFAAGALPNGRTIGQQGRSVVPKTYRMGSGPMSGAIHVFPPRRDKSNRGPKSGWCEFLAEAFSLLAECGHLRQSRSGKRRIKNFTRHFPRSLGAYVRAFYPKSVRRHQAHLRRGLLR